MQTNNGKKRNASEEARGTIPRDNAKSEQLGFVLPDWTSLPLFAPWLSPDRQLPTKAMRQLIAAKADIEGNAQALAMMIEAKAHVKLTDEEGSECTCPLRAEQGQTEALAQLMAARADPQSSLSYVSW